MPGRAVWIQENTRGSRPRRCWRVVSWRHPGRLALFQGRGDPSPWQATRLPYNAFRSRFGCVTPITATSRPRHGEPAMIAPHQEDFLFSCLPDSFGVRSRVALLHGHKCAHWNFGEEFARSIFRQPDAAVRCRIVRHNTSMHSKIETTEAHEIRHLNMVNRRTMVALLVGDHKLASLSRVARPTGRTPRLIYRFTVPDESDPLH